MLQFCLQYNYSHVDNVSKLPYLLEAIAFKTNGTQLGLLGKGSVLKFVKRRVRIQNTVKFSLPNLLNFWEYMGTMDSDETPVTCSARHSLWPQTNLKQT